MPTKKLLADALALPVEERIRLARALLMSLDEDSTTDDVSPTWTAELSHRLEEVRAGTAELVDLDDVDAYVAEKLAAASR